MSRRDAVVALGLDVVLVVLFAAAGRASHDSAVLTGLWQTSWPFLGALVMGWLATRGWRAPHAPVRTGLGVWAVTLAVGMLLRAASGQGVSLPFVLVAAAVLGLLLVGWRLLVAGGRVLARRRARRQLSVAGGGR